MIAIQDLPPLGNAGMGIGVSTGKLAGEVSACGYLGTTSVVAIEQMLVYDLVYGSPPADLEALLGQFPHPPVVQEFRQTIEKLRARKPSRWAGLKWRPITSADDSQRVQTEREITLLAIIASYLENRRAVVRGGGPVAVNLMWKVQLPFLAYLYGAMLAGVDIIQVGAGISVRIPETLEALSRHQDAERPLETALHPANQSEPLSYRLHFSPAEFIPVGALDNLEIPRYLPIVSSNLLVARYQKQLGAEQLFYIEDPVAAGGHNPPARKQDPSQTLHPTYGPKDAIDFEELKRRQTNFYLGGNFCHPAGVEEAREKGALGVLGGSVFALSSASGISRHLRHQALQMLRQRDLKVDAFLSLSSTGLPFQMANVPGSYATHVERMLEGEEKSHFARACSVGLLAELVQCPDGGLTQRCSAEQEDRYRKLGGHDQHQNMRACLCRMLLSNTGRAQEFVTRAPDGSVTVQQDPPLLTLGQGEDTLDFIATLVGRYGLDFSVENIFHELRAGVPC